MNGGAIKKEENDDPSASFKDYDSVENLCIRI